MPRRKGRRNRVDSRVIENHQHGIQLDVADGSNPQVVDKTGQGEHKMKIPFLRSISHGTPIAWSGANPGGRIRLPEREQLEEKKMIKYRKKTTATLLIAIFMISMFAVVMPVGAFYTQIPPTIDGVLDTGEWGDPTFGSDYFNIYVLNNAEYLYVAFETLGGTYLPTGGGDVGMMNLYVMNPDTWECWAYCWIHRTPDLIELKYTYPPDPQETLETGATFAVTETVFELQIPLSELESISLGDTINFHFLSFAEGWTNWSTCWLYDQEYTLELPPPIQVDIDIKPETLNLKSRGRWITAFITLPEGLTGDIDVTTVQLVYEDLNLKADWGAVQKGVFMAKFDRAELIDSLPEDNFSEATLEVTGKLTDGTPFEGTDSVKIVANGKGK